jgi:iron(III) transport system substrate-binding protein
MRAFRLAAGVLALGLITAACSGGTTPTEEPEESSAPTSEPTDGSGSQDEALEELIAAAQAEGRVVWYSTESDIQVAAFAEGFEAEYGIPVEATRLSTGTLTARFASELEAGNVVADAITLSSPPFLDDHLDWWVPFTPDNVPTVGDYPAGAISDQKHYAVVGFTPMGLAVNTDLVDEAHMPTTYADLTDPYWAGKIAYADPRATASGMSLFKILADELGEPYFQSLMANDLQIAEGAGPGTQLVAAGAAAVNIGSFANHVATVTAENAPVVLVTPADLPTGVENQLSIAVDASHPNAARLFAVYRLSLEANELMCSLGGSASPLGEIEGCEPPAPPNNIPTDWDVYEDQAWQREHLPWIGLSPL